MLDSWFLFIHDGNGDNGINGDNGAQSLVLQSIVEDEGTLRGDGDFAAFGGYGGEACGVALDVDRKSVV